MDPATLALVLSTGMQAYGASKKAEADRKAANAQMRNDWQYNLAKLVNQTGTGIGQLGMA